MVDFLRVDDIFSVYPEVFVHPINCVGVTKDILSRQVKKSWPDYFREYTRSCIRKKLQPGEPIWYEVGELFGTRYVVALPLKFHWQEKMRPDLAKQALAELVNGVLERGLSSIAIPLFEGPPEGWIERELGRLVEGRLNCTLSTVYLFNSATV